MLNNLKDLPYYLGSGKAPPDINDGLLAGGIYAIKLQSAPTRLLLMSNALAANLMRGIHCTLITPVSIEELISYCDKNRADLVLKAINSGNLSVFAPIGDYKTNIFRFGPERFLQELEQFSVPNKSFLIIDQADLLFTAEDRGIVTSQASAYKEWARKTQNIALFLFPNTAELEPEGVYFQSLANHFSGIAGLYIVRNRLEVRIDFWTMQSGIMMARQLPVITSEEGLIDIQPSLAANRRSMQRSHKEDDSEKLAARFRLKKTFANDCDNAVHAAEMDNIVLHLTVASHQLCTELVESTPPIIARQGMSWKQRTGRYASIALMLAAVGMVGYSFRTSLGHTTAAQSDYQVRDIQRKPMLKELASMAKSTDSAEKRLTLKLSENTVIGVPSASAQPQESATTMPPAIAPHEEIATVPETLRPSDDPKLQAKKHIISSSRAASTALSVSPRTSSCSDILKALQLCGIVE
ncbi:MAG: BcsE family c-di-GMP-binding protein [Burkholderiaceae bacterium]